MDLHNYAAMGIMLLDEKKNISKVSNNDGQLHDISYP